MDWVRERGGEIAPRSASIAARFPVIHPLASFPNIRGAEGVGPRALVKGTGTTGGINLWALLKQNIEKLRIEVLYSSPVQRLLFDRREGVMGVIAGSAGREIRIRAHRAVILACGGYEFDHSMQLNYLGQRYYGLGATENTGDGIRMAAEIGADLWHMNAVAMTFGYKFPEFEFGIRHSMPAASYIYVDQHGKRFVDETGTDAHMMWSPTSYVDPKTLQIPRVPAYLIFDEATRTKGAVGFTDHGVVSDVYQWSADNSAEIRKGWIKTAGSIVDLAPQMGIAAEQIQRTVVRYNALCVDGLDPEYGRAVETLLPLMKPPYYALQLWPCLFNTQGGPKRNAKAQVLDVWGNPIRRLYSAGELGSLWHRNYPGAGNVSEALAFGRIAGVNAAMEQVARV